MLQHHDCAILWYAEGRAEFPVSYQEGICDCRHCPWIRNNKHLQTIWCELTREYIDKANLNARGAKCPVILPETEF